MVVLVQATVLTVGLDGRNEVLRQLPIRLTTVQAAAEAARSLKSEKVDGVISRWDLNDMQDGRFLNGLRAVMPKIPTIAFIRAGDHAQEIAARSIGISAVLTEQASDELFRNTVANVLGLRDITSIRSISTASTKTTDRLVSDK